MRSYRCEWFVNLSSTAQLSVDGLQDLRFCVAWVGAAHSIIVCKSAPPATHELLCRAVRHRNREDDRRWNRFDQRILWAGQLEGDQSIALLSIVFAVCKYPSTNGRTSHLKGRRTFTRFYSCNLTANILPLFIRRMRYFLANTHDLIK